MQMRKTIFTGKGLDIMMEQTNNPLRVGLVGLGARVKDVLNLVLLPLIKNGKIALCAVCDT